MERRLGKSMIFAVGAMMRSAFLCPYESGSDSGE
jgi:hypothetical protein